jgi:hypothetical protein
MMTKFARNSALALPLLLGIGMAAAAATSGMANSPAATVQCGVTTTTNHGMLTLAGTILSPRALSGSYTVAVQSKSNGGSSNLSQGGAFTVAANQSTTIGTMMLNADARYTVNFQITVDGKTQPCDDTLPIVR